MIKTNIKALERARKKIATLERTIQARLSKELASLPSEYGFDSVKSFIRAVEAAVSITAGKTPGRTMKTKQKSFKRKRVTITDAIRERVRSLAKAGKAGVVIAQAVGISLPTVQNIKKSLGLVKSRAKKPVAAKISKKKRPALKKTVREVRAVKKATSPTPEAPKTAEISEKAVES